MLYQNNLNTTKIRWLEIVSNLIDTTKKMCDEAYTTYESFRFIGRSKGSVGST